MNKTYFLAIMLAMLFSCSSEYKFSEERFEKIWIENISWEIDRNSLYLYEVLLCMENNEQCRRFLLNDWDFFWVIDSDTIRNRRVKEKISYGEHYLKLFLLDIWDDTLSFDTTIAHKEPLGITLLSPINNFPECFVEEFQYKPNGLKSGEETQFFVDICEDRGCSFWNRHNSNKFFEFSETIFWRVGMSINNADTVYSEVRRIICIEE